MIPKVWIWPKTDISDFNIFWDNEFIEEFFEALYLPYKVVYVSRGRVALSLIQKLEDVKRNSLIFVQPYSPHCVLSAIAELATPNTTNSECCNSHIIYHQLGHKTVVDKIKYRNVIIEDSVDSIILTNLKEELFPNNGKYTIISLSKIMKLPFGAIVICQNSADALQLKSLRDSFKKDSKIDLEQIYSNPIFTDAVLAAFPQLSPISDKNGLKNLFLDAKEKVQNNIVKIKEIFPDLEINLENFKNRLPCSLFFNNLSTNTQKNLSAMVEIEAAKRHYFNYNTGEIEVKNLIPVHVDLNMLG